MLDGAAGGLHHGQLAAAVLQDTDLAFVQIDGGCPAHTGWNPYVFICAWDHGGMAPRCL